MKQKRKLIAVIMFFVMLLTTISGPYGNVAKAAAAKRKAVTLKLSASTVTLRQGEKKKIKLQKKKVTVKSSKWSVKNKKIAEVNGKGMVSGISAGKTVLSCKVKYKAAGTEKYKTKNLKCKVTVTNASGDASPAPAEGTAAAPSAAPAQGAGGTQPPSASQNPSVTQEPAPTQPGAATEPPSASQAPSATPGQGMETEPLPTPTQKPTPTPTPTPAPVPTPSGPYDFSVPALGIASQLGAGINIGNNLESNITQEYLQENNYAPTPIQDLYLSGNDGLNAETAWGCPKITKTLLDQIKAAGFTTVRIPVSYINHVKIENGSDGKRVYTIDEQWLNRVKEVVDWAIADGLYVIINIHHDGADNCDGNGMLNLYGGEQATWLSPLNHSGDDFAKMKERFVSLWTQIATRFKDYPNQLFFEDMNEFHHGYNAPQQEWYAAQNKLHQAFVDAVRATGGNNGGRYLIVPGYNTNIDYTIEGLSLPEDIAANRTVYQGNTVGHIIVAVHYYDPFTYAADDPADTVWGSGSGSSTTWANESYLDATMKKMKTNFVDKGVPVVIGEFGAPKHNIDEATDEKYRAYYYSCVVQAAAKYKLVPIAWDNGTTYQLFSRDNGTVTQPKIVEGIIKYSRTPSASIAKPWES